MAPSSRWWPGSWQPTLHDGAAPQWLERLGTWISIAFLLGLES